MHPIGRILEQEGVVSAQDIQAAADAGGQGMGFVSALVRLGAISETDLQTCLSKKLTIPVLPLDALPDAAAVTRTANQHRIPLPWLKSRNLVVWSPDDDADAIFAAGPFVFDAAIQEAAEQWGPKGARLHLASGSAVNAILAASLGETRAHEQSEDVSKLKEMAEAAPAIDFVAHMLAAAVESRASDIHIEPFEETMQVRFRIDGILTNWRRAPRRIYDAISSRIKLLSGMDIAERRLPQDGRQRMRIGGQDHDVRVSTLPTTWGESVVLRFLGRKSTLPELPSLGLEPDHVELLKRLLGQTNGLILVTGPTGSGKTTTVYRLLSELNDGLRKIVTVEDPVELNLPGVLQMHVRSDIGLNFASGLRSILRQDPDIIMVGEIRDSDTARIAVQAALTGHLVISTAHTNSAIAAVSRMTDLGVEDYILADVLRGVIGQRLVRVSCANCSSGCARCNQTGYTGRTGIFELVEITPPLQSAIRHRASEKELLDIARANGFRTLHEDAGLKIQKGVTDEHEALRVVGIAP